MSAKAMFGGLLSGIGEGMVVQAESRRKEALAQAKMILEEVRRREDREHDYAVADYKDGQARERNEANLEARGGLISRTVTAEDGTVWGIRANGDKFDTGIKAPPKGSGDGSGDGKDGGSGIELSAGEKRTFEEIKSRYTNPLTGETDHNAMIAHLRSMPEERGGKRWNEIADYLAGGIGQNMTQTDAREQAASEAQARTGLLSSRETEFPETGGDMERWVEMRTNELLGVVAPAKQGETKQTTQADQEQPKPKGDAKPARSDGQTAGKPPGEGSRVAPFRATEQAHVDWFKSSAPAGAVIEIDGVLYTK